MSLRRATATVLMSIGVAAALFEGCAASDPSPSTTRTTSTGTNGTGSGTGGSAATGAGGGTTGGGATTGTGGTVGPINPGNPDATSDAKLTDDTACAGEPVRGEQRITDLYMMMDTTGSMTTTTDPGANGASRWSLLTAAIPVFVNDMANAGMMVGLDFFPEGTSGMGGASCNVADYTMPNVPVDFIPGPNNMQSNAIIAAVQGRMPAGNTPTVPSLTGALQTALAWQIAHPGRVLSVLYLTDGQPTGCTGNTVPAAAAVAQQYSTGTPPILTYVLGVGPDTGNLDSIAAGGGTRMAYMASSGGAAALSAALAAIRKSTLSCDYNLPKLEGGTLDPNKVNVSVKVGDAGYQDILNVLNVAGCAMDPVRNPGGVGWYYDNPPPGIPTKITLCPNSCGPLQVNPGSEINVLLGCKTRPIPPPASN